jgi:hypothetical protein
METNGNILETSCGKKNQPVFNNCCEICNKEFKTRSGLWKHKKQCNNEDIETENIVVDKNDDKNIENPISRLLIKPFVDFKGKSWLIPEKVYGTPNQYFVNTVENWLVSVQGETPKGSYSLKSGLYIDDINNKHIVLQSKTFNFKIDHRENTKKLEIFVKTKDEKIIKLENDIFLKYGMNTIELDNAKFQKGVIYKIEVLNLNNKNYQWEIILE